MNTFLDKLNSRLNGEIAVDQSASSPKVQDMRQGESLSGSIKGVQLDVDIYQTDKEFVMYAMTPGADIRDFEITIEEESDVVTIKGALKRPALHDGGEEKPIQEECAWGSFYRKLTLPASIDNCHADAIVKKGVLIITLPLLSAKSGMKLEVKEADEDD
jgi:HSP20 family molecular chaperone IbpA